MKRMKFLNGIGAMFALAVVALATTLTSCEKEDFNVNVEPINAQATINTTVLYVDETSTTNVTNDPATVITYSEGPTFTGNPGLSAKEVTVTASYNGITNTAKVSVPALQAGQYLTLSTTIILQKEAPAPVNAKAEIKPVVLYVADGVTTDVTDKAEIVFDPANGGVFEGAPELAATLSKITATYEGVSATISVNVPALAAGQSATMSPTIILQKQVGKKWDICFTFARRNMPLVYPYFKLEWQSVVSQRGNPEMRLHETQPFALLAAGRGRQLGLHSRG